MSSGCLGATLLPGYPRLHAIWAPWERWLQGGPSTACLPPFRRSLSLLLRSPTRNMRQISLIVATVSRVNQLDILLNSLNRQTYLDFEVLVVDQNPDDRLLPVLQA